MFHLLSNMGSVNYTLLASNDEEKYKNFKRLKEIMNDHFRGINFTTHQEKLAEANLYYERKIWLN